jgi:hypothetical protein
MTIISGTIFAVPTPSTTSGLLQATAIYALGGGVFKYVEFDELIDEDGDILSLEILP